jgi:hypothetical protein
MTRLDAYRIGAMIGILSSEILLARIHEAVVELNSDDPSEAFNVAVKTMANALADSMAAE